MSRRAERPKRIEEGADNLATFVEDLSVAEWHLQVSATDRRSIGVIVHHVASMYPIEIDLHERLPAEGRDGRYPGSCCADKCQTRWEQSKITRPQRRNSYGTTVRRQPLYVNSVTTS
jgi:hypothetical protein